MRNIAILLLIIIPGMYSCKNSDWEFPDFDYTTTYFPYQYPVRTLVLGDYFFDNENDNNHKFLISARVAGMYQNKNNWTIGYQLDPSLAENLATQPNLWDGKIVAAPDTLKILPSQYYTLNPLNNFVIPKGSFHGGIEVQLTEDFFNDPLAVKTTYVIPLKITSSQTDSILVGKTGMPSPDPRVSTDWVTVPKNFTIFAIKYVNEYHGKYLHRGRSTITDTTTSTILETITYRQRYVEHDEIWALQTVGRNTVRIRGTLRQSPTSPGIFIMDLTFDNNNNCIIKNASDSPFEVNGTGKYVPNGDMWGDKPRHAIHLNYTVTDGPNKHEIVDTLVFRDKAVTLLEYTPVIIN